MTPSMDPGVSTLAMAVAGVMSGIGLAMLGGLWKIYDLTRKNHAVLTGNETRAGVITRVKRMERYLSKTTEFYRGGLEPPEDDNDKWADGGEKNEP